MNYIDYNLEQYKNINNDLIRIIINEYSHIKITSILIHKNNYKVISKNYMDINSIDKCVIKIRECKCEFKIKINNKNYFTLPVFTCENILEGCIVIENTKSNSFSHKFKILINFYKKLLESELLKYKLEYEYDFLFNNSTSGIAIYKAIDNGENFIVKNINSQFEKIESVKKTNIIDKKITDVCPKIHEKDFLNSLKNVSKTGEKCHLPTVIYKDNEIKGYRENFIYKINEEELIVFYTDLTKQKIKEEKLKKINDRLNLVIEENKIGIWDFDTITGKFNVSKIWKEITNIEEDFNKDISYFDLLKDIIDENYYEEVIKAINNHINRNIEKYDMEYKIKQSNGIKWIKDLGKLINGNNNEKKVVGLIQDISERKLLEEKNKNQKILFQQLFEESNEAIALLDSNGLIIQINSQFEELFNYKNENVISRDINKLILPEKVYKDENNYIKLVSNGINIKTESIRKNKLNEIIHVSIHSFPIKFSDGKVGIYSIYHDISLRIEEENKIKYLSFHDQLTGIYNRHYFNIKIEKIDVEDNLPISIIMADIDHLKIVNDTYGHAEGDEYISLMVSLISVTLNEKQTFARIGGDEFAILLPNKSYEDTKTIVKSIRTNINNYKSDKPYDLDISIGFATKMSSHQTLEKIMIKADNKMYINKKKKKENN